MFAVGVIAYRLLVDSFPFANSTFDDEPGENAVGHPAMEAIRTRLCQASICWDHSAFSNEPVARKLLERALSVKEELRPTALEALADPWFASCPRFAVVNRTRSAPIISPSTSRPNSKTSSVKSKFRSYSGSTCATVADLTSEANLDLTKQMSQEWPVAFADIPMPPGCINSN